MWVAPAPSFQVGGRTRASVHQETNAHLVDGPSTVRQASAPSHICTRAAAGVLSYPELRVAWGDLPQPLAQHDGTKYHADGCVPERASPLEEAAHVGSGHSGGENQCRDEGLDGP